MTAPQLVTDLAIAGAIVHEPITAISPGVYPGVPKLLYHRWPGASNSRLTAIRQTPAHMKALLDAPDDASDTPAKLLGTAIHSVILEPDDFASTYTIADQCEATKKSDGLRCSNPGVDYHVDKGWLCGQHSKGLDAGFANIREVLSASDYATCLGIRDSVYAHPKARLLLTAAGETELSVVWTDADAGIPCKARFDRYAPGMLGGVILDVKSTEDASPRAFEKSVEAYGYHRQGAMYLDGARAAGLGAAWHVHIAVEKKGPLYAAAAYQLDEESIEFGRKQLKPLMRRYADCLARDVWPGYSENIVTISLPDWAWQKIEREVEAASVKPAAPKVAA